MMTDFQKEVILLGICLSFFFVCSSYAGTVSTVAGAAAMVTMIVKM